MMRQRDHNVYPLHSVAATFGSARVLTMSAASLAQIGVANYNRPARAACI